MPDKFLPISALHNELAHLIRNLGCNELEIPLETKLTTNGKEFHFQAEYKTRMAWVRWLNRAEDLQLSLVDYSERFLKPAALQCAQLLNP